jgi:hypothetical protein
VATDLCDVKYPTVQIEILPEDEFTLLFFFFFFCVTAVILFIVLALPCCYLLPTMGRFSF